MDNSFFLSIENYCFVLFTKLKTKIILNYICFFSFYLKQLIMNGFINNHDPSTGYYTGNDPIQSSYYGHYPSTFTTNIHTPQSYLLQQYDNNNNNNLQQPFLSSDPKLNGLTRHNFDIQHQFNTMNFQKQDQPSANSNVYNFENGGLDAIAYYDRIHTHIQQNHQQQNITSTNTNHLNVDYLYTQSPSPNLLRQTTPAIPNSQTESTFLVIPATTSNGSSNLIQVTDIFHFKESHTRDGLIE